MKDLKDLLKSIKQIKKGKENKLANRLELTEDIVRVYRDYLTKVTDEIPWAILVSHGYNTSKEFGKEVDILTDIYSELNLHTDTTGSAKE